MALDLLKHKFNFIHNINVLNEKSGVLIVQRRAPNAVYDDYLPCVRCKCFMKKHELTYDLKPCNAPSIPELDDTGLDTTGQDTTGQDTTGLDTTGLRQSEFLLENELHNARDQLNSTIEKLQKAKDQLCSQKIMHVESRQIQEQNKILTSSLNRQKRDLEMILDEFSLANDELNNIKKLKTTKSTSKPLSRKAYKGIHKQKQRLSLKAAKLEAEWGVVSDKLDFLTRFVQNGDMTSEKITEICKCISNDINDNTKRQQLKQLVEALSSPISTKEKGSYKDNVALLTMLSQTFGVPANSVGKVQEACCQLLLNRDLQNTVSRSTAARMMRRGGILAEAQIGIAFAEHGHRGVRIGQDTTTRQRTEHVSKYFNMELDCAINLPDSNSCL